MQSPYHYTIAPAYSSSLKEVTILASSYILKSAGNNMSKTTAMDFSSENYSNDDDIK